MVMIEPTEARRFIGTRPDGIEVLVTVWDDRGEYAERRAIDASGFRVWGPPVALERVP